MNNIFEHYHPLEKPFIERVIELSERVTNSHVPILTDFMDPRQKEITQSIVNSYQDLTVFFDGGYPDAERIRAFITPDYWDNNKGDMLISIYQVIGENKFDHLSHRDYLGALLSLGIKREKFGDILLDQANNYYIVAKEIADYLTGELRQIGKTKITLQEIKQGKLIIPKNNYQAISLTVTSLRVDNVLSQLYNQSRANVSDWIKKNKVKVNWQIVNQVDYKLKAGDIISLRGLGRSKLIEEEGITKKGKLKIVVGILQ